MEGERGGTIWEHGIRWRASKERCCPWGRGMEDAEGMKQQALRPTQGQRSSPSRALRPGKRPALAPGQHLTQLSMRAGCQQQGSPHQPTLSWPLETDFCACATACGHVIQPVGRSSLKGWGGLLSSQHTGRTRCSLESGRTWNGPSPSAP